MHLHQLGWASCAQPPPRKDRNRDVGPQGSNEDKEGTPPHPHPQTEPGTWGACHIRVVNSLTVTGCCPPFSQPLAWPISSRWEKIRVGGLLMGSDRRTDVDPAAPSSIKRAHGACSRMERGGMAGVVPATLGCPCCGGWAGRGQGTGQPCLPLSPPLSLSLQPCGHQGAVW